MNSQQKVFIFLLINYIKQLHKYYRFYCITKKIKNRCIMHLKGMINMIIKLLLTSFISVPNYLVTTNIYKNEQASLSRVAYDLSTLLEDNLGNITDTSINVLETILIKKYNVDVNQIELQNLSYGDVNVVAKKDSLDYFGSKYITFNINLTLLGTKISTKNLYVNAYNSIQKDSQKLTIKYESNFGKNIFTEYFKNIEFE